MRRAFFEGSCGRHIVSGGNDAHVLLWDWPQSLPEEATVWRAAFPTACGSDESSSSHHGPVLRINNRRKINCVASAEGSDVIIVADTSRVLKCFSVL